MIINYVCKTCNNEIMKLTDDPDKVVGVIPCAACGGYLEREIGGPSSNAVESVDNGFMVRAVDFDSNRNELRKVANEKFLRDLKDKK